MIKPQTVTFICNSPYTVLTAQNEAGWVILVSPGPLADLLRDLAQVNQQLETFLFQDLDLMVIPLTQGLDENLKHLANLFTAVRYETNQVQFTLELPIV